MKELQELINNWKQLAEKYSAEMDDNSTTTTDYCIITGKDWRLRKCISEVELLLNPQPNNDTPPQLNKHDVSSSEDEECHICAVNGHCSTHSGGW